MSTLSQFVPFVSGGGGIKTYTQSGVYTSTQSISIPSGTTLLGALLIGGGGAGGYGRDGGTGATGGFGGAQIFLIPVLGETTMTLTIGAGGTVTAGTGNAGGTTILTLGSGLVAAKVGGGGGGGDGNNWDQPPTTGGTGFYGGAGGGGGRSYQGYAGSGSSGAPWGNGTLFWSLNGQSYSPPNSVFGQGSGAGSGTYWGINLASYGYGGGGGSYGYGAGGGAGAASFRYYS